LTDAEWRLLAPFIPKDYEYLTASSESFIYAATIRLMLKRLAQAPAHTG
jgi:transposase